ncbi:hypothetical protein AAFN85_30850 [Mucilaginibacter sp. CAU 1740]|uniref:hypothetical protein n=1 Tax=Mucilaginibacter sp. CAU 1740 TaxID=3140365 RepID=UPI00325C0AC3
MVLIDLQGKGKRGDSAQGSGQRSLPGDLIFGSFYQEKEQSLPAAIERADAGVLTQSIFPGGNNECLTHCVERVQNDYFANKLTSSPSWPGGARYFCLDTKVPKKSSHQEGFFARSPAHHPPLAFALQTGQNHGLLNFALLYSLVAPASAKSSYAPSYAQGHHRSARFRPKLSC